ncbi:MAG TPA: hypothetical protein VGE34_01420 [Candidatus Saccharimonadales bacterium]
MEADVSVDNPRKLSEERLKIRDEAIELVRALGAQKVADVVKLTPPTTKSLAVQPHHTEVA